MVDDAPVCFATPLICQLALVKSMLRPRHAKASNPYLVIVGVVFFFLFCFHKRPMLSTTRAVTAAIQSKDLILNNFSVNSAFFDQNTGPCQSSSTSTTMRNIKTMELSSSSFTRLIKECPNAGIHQLWQS